MATESDSVSTGAIGTLFAVLAVAVGAVTLALTAMVRTEQSDLAASRESQANLRPLRELRATQLAELNVGVAWVDRAKGTVSLPIDQAMELVVRQERTASIAPPKDSPDMPGGAPLPTASASITGAMPAAGKPLPSSNPPGAVPSDPSHVH